MPQGRHDNGGGDGGYTPFSYSPTFGTAYW